VNYSVVGFCLTFILKYIKSLSGSRNLPSPRFRRLSFRLKAAASKRVPKCQFCLQRALLNATFPTSFSEAVSAAVSPLPQSCCHLLSEVVVKMRQKIDWLRNSQGEASFP